MSKNTKMLNRNKLQTAVRTNCNIPAPKAEETVIFIFDWIKEQVIAGNEVNISGFGKFKPVHRDSRVCWNPIKEVAWHTHEKMAVKFSPSADFKKKMADALHPEETGDKKVLK